MAVFLWKLQPFIFIPASVVELGFDDRIALISADQRHNWNIETRDYLGGVELEDYLKDAMTPIRTATIAPFLIQAIPDRLGPTTPVVISSGDMKIDYTMIRDACTSDHFRLPTSDEWEYVCGAGSQQLFRWGNDCPLGEDNGPLAVCHWSKHRRVNAFGLQMPSNPYDWEVCEEAGTMRGGDGGMASHGGVGTFAEWLTLATAFQIHWNAPLSSVHMRRVLPLS